MHLGMPVVALATTEAVVAVLPDTGILSTRVDTLLDATAWLLDEPAEAHRIGTRAAEVARARYGLDRFLNDRDRLLTEEQCG
jgi:glycosyltransferase involved in cell wall biosynthesis